MKIAILSREPRIYSTKRLKEAGRDRGHKVIVVDHTKCDVVIEKNMPIILYKGKELKKIDAVIPRIGASVTFFGTAVVRQFEMMNIFTANSSYAISQSRDKLKTLQLLSAAGIGIPKTVFAKFPKGKDVDELIDLVGGAPLIIKLLQGTQGIGVVLTESKKAARSEIEAFTGLKTNFLIQEYISESKGADVRALVVGNKVVGSIKRQGKEGEFRSNIHRGGKGVKVKLTEEEKEIAIKAAHVTGLHVAGVDMLQSTRGPLVLEINSSPGLKGLEQTLQKNIAEYIIKYIEKKVAGSKDRKK